jgi:hypothetical protein
MNIIYAIEPLVWTEEKSIFLAGPTPRDGQSEKSWRPQAIRILESLNYEGYVYVPEPRDGIWKCKYEEQVEWEEEALTVCDCILFWLPRSEAFPGFTTNDEWGCWKRSGKVVFGAPDNAMAVRYQWYYAKKYNIPGGNTLELVCKAALEMISV